MPDWTDDLTLPLPPGRTVTELVDAVLEASLAGTPTGVISGRLARDFALSRDDAEFAQDRVQGGLVRAGTGNPANQPDSAKDPIAAESFRRGAEDPSLVARIVPGM